MQRNKFTCFSDLLQLFLINVIVRHVMRGKASVSSDSGLMWEAYALRRNRCDVTGVILHDSARQAYT